MTHPYINNCSYTPPNQNTTDQEGWITALGSALALLTFGTCAYVLRIVCQKHFKSQETAQTEGTQSGGTNDSLKIDKKPAEHINKSFTNDELEFFTTIKTNPSDTEVVGDTATTTIDVPEQ